MNISKIAHHLYDLKEKIILIYAFNSTGKTRLSVEYKNITKDANNGEHAGVYYNAFSEDLFVWDNDLENNETNIKLNILQSSLNQFYVSLTEQKVRDKLMPYKPKYNFQFNQHNDPELGIESVSFYLGDNQETSIKISRGEERIFVWCFFLALFDVENWAGQQNKHFFIDDPVSSLDDHNIFITAFTIISLILKYFEDRKIIIVTHHMGLFSILSDLFGKSEYADKFRNNDKERTKKYKIFILEREGDSFDLLKNDNSVLLYHLRLLQILEKASKIELRTYHFALLRQVLENIASFLGVGRINYVLDKIGIQDPARASNFINALSHQKVYFYQTDLMVPEYREIFIEVLDGLMKTYNFVLHTD